MLQQEFPQIRNQSRETNVIEHLNESPVEFDTWLLLLDSLEKWEMDRYHVMSRIKINSNPLFYQHNWNNFMSTQIVHCTKKSPRSLDPPFQSVCDGTKNVKRYRYRYFFPVPNVFDTNTGTFVGTKFFWYQFQDFFPIPNFTDTGSETFFWYQILPIPVPIPPKKWKIPGTGMSHSGAYYDFT